LTSIAYCFPHLATPAGRLQLVITKCFEEDSSYQDINKKMLGLLLDGGSRMTLNSKLSMPHSCLELGRCNHHRVVHLSANSNLNFVSCLFSYFQMEKRVPLKSFLETLLETVTKPSQIECHTTYSILCSNIF